MSLVYTNKSQESLDITAINNIFKRNILGTNNKTKCRERKWEENQLYKYFKW